jgi:acyl carrier protein
MSIEQLIKVIQDEVDDLDLKNLTPDTVFVELEGWSSLYGLILMALVSTEYNVELSGQQIRTIRTVQDLYNIINQA